MEGIFFESPGEFRGWLEANHETAAELLVGFHKRSTARPSLTWPQSVDEALCFGWIDGVRRRVDRERYTIRFTPRKPGSIWSRVNIAKVEALSQAGLMRPAGVKAFEARDEAKSAIYAYEQRFSAALDEEATARFRSNEVAWAFFEVQAAWYKRTAIYWVTSAKQASTRKRRLEELIEASAQGRRIGPLVSPRTKRD
jgi:uncharacterized protein YdeI (YjbR/CyaY-like superfamily)